MKKKPINQTISVVRVQVKLLLTVAWLQGMVYRGYRAPTEHACFSHHYEQTFLGNRDIRTV